MDDGMGDPMLFTCGAEVDQGGRGIILSQGRTQGTPPP